MLSDCFYTKEELKSFKILEAHIKTVNAALGLDYCEDPKHWDEYGVRSIVDFNRVLRQDREK